jgi:protease PrsW
VLLSFVGSALFGALLLLVIRRIGYLQRGSLALLVLAGVWGALAAAGLAGIANDAGTVIIQKITAPAFAADWVAALTAPLTEEILKILGIVAIVLLARRRITGVLDGFVYGALIGLGFKVVEDASYGYFAPYSSLGDPAAVAVDTLLLRTLFVGWTMHVLWTALSGAGIIYALVRTDRGRWVRIAVAALAFTGAWALHFTWNSPLPTSKFFLQLPVLALVLPLVLWAVRREGSRCLAPLAVLGDEKIATSAELTVLPSGSRRRQARRSVRRLQRAQILLAAALRAGVGPATVARRTRKVLARREEMARLGLVSALSPPLIPTLRTPDASVPPRVFVSDL